MKRFAVLAAFFLAAAPSWAQQGMGGMDMKDHGPMDMSRCQGMKDKGMTMPQECTDMMDKPGMGTDKNDAANKGGEKKGGDKKAGGKKAQAKVHKGSGIPTKVDAAAGKVTIDHGPIATIGWPAMSMTFTVKDKSALAHVHEGSKVEFEFVQQGKDYVITKIH